jgi:hypothetical protein
VEFGDLLDHPHRAVGLHPTQVQGFLSSAAELVTQSTRLHDYLARQLPSTAMIVGRSLREVRSIVRLNNGGGFTFEDATTRVRVKDRYELRRLLADMVTDGWIVNDLGDH